MYDVETLTVGELSSNCYIVKRELFCVIIDPGDEADFISDKINNLKVTPCAVLATHGHFDHTLASFELTENYKIPLFIDIKDDIILRNIRSSAKHWLNRKDIINPRNVKYFGKRFETHGIKFDIIRIPGHTPGGVGLYNKKQNILFSGDLIFNQSGIGRYDFSYSSHEYLIRSLKILKNIPKKYYSLSRSW